MIKKDKTVKEDKPAKKIWSKPILYSGKGIDFLRYSRMQSSTGPYGTPS